MKKLSLLISFCLIIFAACGGTETEPDTPQETPQENNATTEPQHTPHPEPAPTQTDPHTIFESGTLGIKFQFDNQPGFNFEVFSRSNVNRPLIWHLDWPTVGGFSLSETFSISMFTTPHAGWRMLFSDYADFFPGGFMHWQPPDAPDEVFVTESGLSVVKYSIIRTNEDWDDFPDYVTTAFIFRQDGRDYREFEGTQVYFAAVLEAVASRHAELYDYARAVVNSLIFLDGEDAAVNLELTDTAFSIGITQTNYPRIDGSTSTVPLMAEIFQAMFHPLNRAWWDWDFNIPGPSSRTVPSYELLLMGEVDMILVPNPSAFVLHLAEQAGIELEFIPIATEALVFITSVENPVSEITMQQLLQIYQHMTITNWAQLGGYDGRIIPFSRNPHSGSQALFEHFIMTDGVGIHPDLTPYEVGGMADMLYMASSTEWWFLPEPESQYFGLGYTVYFFLQQADWINQMVKPLAFDGVFPSEETIRSGEYPLSTSYFAVIRSDSPADSPERRIIEWLQTPEGQSIVERAGLGTLW